MPLTGGGVRRRWLIIDPGRRRFDLGFLPLVLGRFCQLAHADAAKHDFKGHGGVDALFFSDVVKQVRILPGMTCGNGTIDQLDAATTRRRLVFETRGSVQKALRPFTHGRDKMQCACSSVGTAQHLRRKEIGGYIFGSFLPPASELSRTNIPAGYGLPR